MSARRQRPGFGAVVTNWRTYDAPFATKVRMLLRNNWTKARNRSNCCGNNGEPGCRVVTPEPGPGSDAP